MKGAFSPEVLEKLNKEVLYIYTYRSPEIYPDDDLRACRHFCGVLSSPITKDTRLGSRWQRLGD